MRVRFITCWANPRVYSLQSLHLKTALEKLLGRKIDIVTSNCGCFYHSLPEAFSSMFGYPADLIDTDVTFIPWPHFRYRKSETWLKRAPKGLYRKTVEVARGWQYSRSNAAYDITHYHQAPDAFGFEQLKWVLKRKNGGKTVVTVHSLSPVQHDTPEVNALYNTADALIVNTNHLRRKLVSLGVAEGKIHVIPYSGTVRPDNGCVREGAVLFGGAYLIKVKGFEFIVPALKRLRDTGIPIRLSVLGNFNPGHKDWGEEIVREHGVEDLVLWKNFHSEEDLYQEHERSLFSLIPYTNNAGSFPVTISMATGTPVIATTELGTAEYLHDSGLIVKSRSVEALENAMRTLMLDESLRRKLGLRARMIAEQEYAWDVVAGKTLKLYEALLGEPSGH